MACDQHCLQLSSNPSGPKPYEKRDSASALIISASHKAGIGIDRTQIDEILLRESADSGYMKQQRKRSETVDRKIQAMKDILERKDLTQPRWRSDMEQKLQSKLQSWLSTVTTNVVSSNSTSVVVDMDSFYISCELLSRPELQNVPCCVGFSSSIISTSNYAARKYGVRSAMPGWIAAKLVSELSHGKDKLRFLPHNFELYERMSSCVKEVLLEYDPWLQSYSMDEAYLELQPYLNLRLGRGWDHDTVTHALKLEFQRHQQQGWEDSVERSGTTIQLTPADVLHEMRAKVFEKTGLTCSAGMATNHMLAKIASDINKPNGQLCVGPSQHNILDFIRPLPVRKIPGIGRVLEQTLHAFQIITVADLYENRAILPFLFKDGATSDFLLRVSIGMSSSSDKAVSAAKQFNCKKIEDYCCMKEKASPTACKPSIVNSTGSINMRKGISRERTFSSGRSWPELVAILKGITAMLINDLIKEGLKARTITVKVKLHTFDVMSRSKSLPQGIFFSNSTASMFPIAHDLLNDARKVKHECISGSRKFNCRLLGVRFSNLETVRERGTTSSRKACQQLKLEPFISQPTSSITGTPQHLLQQQRCIALQTNTEELNDTVDQEEDQRAIKEVHTHSITKFFTTQKDISSGEKNPPSCCPVCNKPLPSLKNEEVNSHLDMCLNSMSQSQLLKKECEKKEGVHLSRKRRVTDFFSNIKCSM